MSSTLNLDDVQGDILVGLPKKCQQYIIFQINNDVAGFRKALTRLIPLITTTSQVMQDRNNIAANKKAAQEQGKTPERLTLTGVNIAFAHAGLHVLGINDNIRDDVFTNGQKADAQSLNDPGHSTGLFAPWEPNWDPAFLSPVHGVILISGDSDETVTATRKQIETIFDVGGFNATMREVITLSGSVRPGDQKGHEHFGFLDGISQPAVKGVDLNPNPGQGTVRPGVILCARDGDNTALFRPSWAKDGSFMVLRWLWQLVPEFNAFCKFHPIQEGDLTPEQGSELLAARLMGRWKSGAPVDIARIKDNPELGADPLRNNKFDYSSKGDDKGLGCPLAAHARKCNPRSDLDSIPVVTLEPHRVLRRGIPFGPEVTPEEAASNTTKEPRGLIFVCYQSNISDGFRFIQRIWANDPKFPPKGLFPLLANPGYDPIVGQAQDETTRTIAGVDPSSPTSDLHLPTEWVVPKGGEYFFSPSLPALRTRAVAMLSGISADSDGGSSCWQ